MVVPIFVPKIIPIDCVNESIPAEMNPSVITITAELLCKIHVMRIPASNPFHGVSVKWVNLVLNDSSEIVAKPDLNRVIPKINKPINKIKTTKINRLHPHTKSYGDYVIDMPKKEYFIRILKTITPKAI